MHGQNPLNNVNVCHKCQKIGKLFRLRFYRLRLRRLSHRLFLYATFLPQQPMHGLLDAASAHCVINMILASPRGINSNRIMRAGVVVRLIKCMFDL
jgi:hypothetical protein